MVYKSEDVYCELLYDGMNFIVEHKKINDDKNSKNYGKVVIDGTRSYFSGAKSMANSICDRVLGDAIDNNIENLSEHLDKAINELIEEFKKKKLN